MQTIQVRTTQNVFISYPLGSVGDRIGALLIDWVILGVYSLALAGLYFNIEMEEMWVWIVTVGGPWLFYNLAFEIAMNGQTPGKRVLEMKVIRMDGTPASIGDYLIRWIFGFVDIYILSGAIAIIFITSGGKGQRLGDVMAGTTVIKLVQQKEIKAEDIFISPPQDYTPIFTQVAYLNSRDIELIQRALEVNRNQGNPEPMMAVAERIKSLLAVQTDMPPVQFLYTIVKDFNHITSR